MHFNLRIIFPPCIVPINTNLRSERLRTNNRRRLHMSSLTLAQPLPDQIRPYVPSSHWASSPRLMSPSLSPLLSATPPFLVHILSSSLRPLSVNLLSLLYPFLLQVLPYPLQPASPTCPFHRHSPRTAPRTTVSVKLLGVLVLRPGGTHRRVL